MIFVIIGLYYSRNRVHNQHRSWFLDRKKRCRQYDVSRPIHTRSVFYLLYKESGEWSTIIQGHGIMYKMLF